MHNSNPINIEMPSKGCMLSKGQGYTTQVLSNSYSDIFKGQRWITQVLYKGATIITCYYLSSAFNSIIMAEFVQSNSLLSPIICSSSSAGSTTRGSTDPTSRQPCRVLQQHMGQWTVSIDEYLESFKHHTGL